MADNNKIRDISGIFSLEGLVQVSLRGNRLSGVDLRDAKWSQLEVLNLGQNCLESIRGLDRLKSLKSLDLGEFLDLGMINADCRIEWPHAPLL